MATKRILRRVIFWLVLCSLTVLLFIFVRSYFFQTFRIVSDSMLPTLHSGDRVLVSRVSYRIPSFVRTIIGASDAQLLPQRGDIVVFSRFSEYQPNRPGQHFIKRVMAIPGDSIGVINGELVLGHAATTDVVFDYGPIDLKSGEYFVSGDNRNNSKDSRFFGPINLNDIEGRALMIVWSTEVLVGKLSPRFDRIGTVLR